jgi:hypothetical protein
VLCGHPVRLEGYLGAAGERSPYRSHLWSWVAGRFRGGRGTFAHRTADTKSERS